MKIVVLDKNFRQIDVWNGTLAKGIFSYKTGEWDIFGLWKFGGTENQQTINYEDTIDEGKQKVAYVQFDGKDYHQLKLIDMRHIAETEKEILQKDAKRKEILSSADYMHQYHIAQLHKTQMIEKPPHNNGHNAVNTKRVSSSYGSIRVFPTL